MPVFRGGLDSWLVDFSFCSFMLPGWTTVTKLWALVDKCIYTQSYKLETIVQWQEGGEIPEREWKYHLSRPHCVKPDPGRGWRTTAERGQSRFSKNSCLTQGEEHMKDDVFTRVLYPPLTSLGYHSCSCWMPHSHEEFILLPVPTIHPDILSKLEPGSMLNSEGFALTLYKLLGKYSDQVNEALVLSVCLSPHLTSVSKALHRGSVWCGLACLSFRQRERVGKALEESQTECPPSLNGKYRLGRILEI